MRLLLCFVALFLISCATVQNPPVNTVSLVLQGVRFYFSVVVPSEIPVEAVGTGSTREKAIDNALLSAVQQAVGVLVVSDVTVESNRVIRDFVANYSSGLVKEYKVKECKETNRVECTITAVVSSSAFQQKLLSTTSVTRINGENLYGQYLTSRNAIIQRYRITEYFFSRIRTQGLQVKLIRFEVQPTTKTKIPIYIEYSIRFDPHYKKILINLLEKLQSDTNSGFNIWTGKWRESAKGVDPYTIFIQWGPTGLFENRVWINTYDYNYAQMMRRYEYADIPIRIKELNICDRVETNSIFSIDWYGLTRKGMIEVDPEKLRGVKQLTLEIGC